MSAAPTRDSWRNVLASAYLLFDDLQAKGFGTPPFSLGGGTVLMLRFEHRLSKDIDLFGYDAQWLSFLSPRLNETAAAMATDYLALGCEPTNTRNSLTEANAIPQGAPRARRAA